MWKIKLYCLLFIIALLLIPFTLFARASNEWISSSRNDGCGNKTFFINNKTGWFYNNNTNVICRTDDGGLRVQKQYLGMEVTSIFFLNNTTGWAAGNIAEYDDNLNQIDKVWGQIKVTTDGGKTWNTDYNEFLGHDMLSGLRNIYFVSSSIGWAVGDKGLVIYSSDGGKHWEHQDSGTNLILREVYFDNEKTGVIIGDRRYALGENNETDQKAEGVILYTDDSGAHWRKVWSKRPVLINGLNFISDKTGFATVEIMDGSLLLITMDSGKSWSETKVNYSGLGRPLFIDSNRGLITMGENMVIVTSDGGKTWIKREIPTSTTPWHFSKLFEKK